MKYDVFISYSQKDRDIVIPFVQRISDETGAKCWIDQDGIESGVEFESKIKQAIDSSATLLFMLSDNSISSIWTQREVFYAEKKKKRIVPVILDHQGLRDWSEIHFINIDCIEIHNPTQCEKLIRNISDWCVDGEKHFVEEAKHDILLPAYKDGKWGFINHYGYMVIAPQYDDVIGNSVTSEIILVKQNDKVGYIDRTGNLICSPKFDDIHHYDDLEHFHNGYAAVCKYGKWGLIDKKGAYVVPPKYAWIECGFDPDIVDDNWACFSTFNNKLVWIDKEGKVQLELDFSNRKIHSDRFHEGLLAVGEVVGEEEQWGFVDKTGKWVIPPQFGDAEDFENGRALVRMEKNGKTYAEGYIDKRGKWIGASPFRTIRKMSEGLMAVKKNELYGFVDETLDWAIKPQFADVGDFSNNLAKAKKEAKGLYGFINKRGKWEMPPQFANVEIFSEGLAAAKKRENGKYGYINKQGEWVISPLFSDCNSFENGFASVQLEFAGKRGLIDKKGDFVIPPQFEWFFWHQGGNFCEVKQDGKYGLVDSRCRWILQPIYEWIGVTDDFIITDGKGCSGVFDWKGKIIIKPKYDYVCYYGDEISLFYAEWDGNCGYFGIDEKIIYQWRVE